MRCGVVLDGTPAQVGVARMAVQEAGCKVVASVFDPSGGPVTLVHNGSEIGPSQNAIPPVAWQGFLEEAVRPENQDREIGGLLFSSRPAQWGDLWVVFPCKTNTAKKSKTRWCPSKTEWLSIMRHGREMELCFLGTVHTHAIYDGEAPEACCEPSRRDLQSAQKHFENICGIVTVDRRAEPARIYKVLFHDYWGRKVAVTGAEKNAAVENFFQGTPAKL